MSESVKRSRFTSSLEGLSGPPKITSWEEVLADCRKRMGGAPKEERAETGDNGSSSSSGSGKAGGCSDAKGGGCFDGKGGGCFDGKGGGCFDGKGGGCLDFKGAGCFGTKGGGCFDVKGGGCFDGKSGGGFDGKGGGCFDGKGGGCFDGKGGGCFDGKGGGCFDGKGGGCFDGKGGGCFDGKGGGCFDAKGGGCFDGKGGGCFDGKGGGCFDGKGGGCFDAKGGGCAFDGKGGGCLDLTGGACFDGKGFGPFPASASGACGAGPSLNDAEQLAAVASGPAAMDTGKPGIDGGGKGSKDAASAAFAQVAAMKGFGKDSKSGGCFDGKSGGCFDGKGGGCFIDSDGKGSKDAASAAFAQVAAMKGFGKDGKSGGCFDGKSGGCFDVKGGGCFIDSDGKGSKDAASAAFAQVAAMKGFGKDMPLDMLAGKDPGGKGWGKAVANWSQPEMPPLGQAAAPAVMALGTEPAPWGSPKADGTGKGPPDEFNGGKGDTDALGGGVKGEGDKDELGANPTVQSFFSGPGNLAHMLMKQAMGAPPPEDSQEQPGRAAVAAAAQTGPLGEPKGPGAAGCPADASAGAGSSSIASWTEASPWGTSQDAVWGKAEATAWGDEKKEQAVANWSQPEMPPLGQAIANWSQPEMPPLGQAATPAVMTWGTEPAPWGSPEAPPWGQGDASSTWGHGANSWAQADGQQAASSLGGAAAEAAAAAAAAAQMAALATDPSVIFIQAAAATGFTADPAVSVASIDPNNGAATLYALAQLAEESAQYAAAAAAFCAVPREADQIHQVTEVANAAEQAGKRASWAAKVVAAYQPTPGSKLSEDGDTWLNTIKGITHQAAESAEQAVSSCRETINIQRKRLPDDRPRHSEPGEKRSRVPCKRFIETGQCFKGDDCPFSHDQRDRAPRLLKHKRPLICTFWEKGECIRGSGCTFAHGQEELATIIAVKEEEDQKWKQRRMAEPFQMRPGDWECSGCGDLQFARNSHCRRCGVSRDAPPKPHKRKE